MRHARPFEGHLGRCPDAWRPEFGCSATGDGRCGEPEGSKITALRDGIGSRSLPTPSPCPPRPVPGCFPSGSPALAPKAGKHTAAPRGYYNTLSSLRKSGAGEGIRTLDPNLSKVALQQQPETKALTEPKSVLVMVWLWEWAGSGSTKPRCLKSLTGSRDSAPPYQVLSFRPAPVLTEPSCPATRQQFIQTTRTLPMPTPPSTSALCHLSSVIPS
jgi:hypothetical protein